MTIVLTIFGTILGIIAVAMISEIIARWQRLPFDPASWQFRPRERCRLVHDLLKSERLRGSCREEILTLLGHPDYESGCSVAYYLTGDKFGDKLRIRIGADGRAYKAKMEHGC